MGKLSTILLEKEVIEEIKMAKEYPRQTYSELFKKMLKLFSESKKRHQYDDFLHQIQKSKMQELWDNKEDEAWEDV